MHKVRLIYLGQAVILLSLLTSCSFFGEKEQAISPHQFNTSSMTIDIYAGHGFLGGSSYERYYLENNKLWRECGALSEDETEAKPSAFAEVFAAHPSIQPKDASFETLTPKQLTDIARAMQALKTVANSNVITPQQAGSLFSLSSGGAFEMKFSLNGGASTISSSLSAISNAESPRDKAANELFMVVRGVGREMCSSKIFFGVGRKCYGIPFPVRKPIFPFALVPR